MAIAQLVLEYVRVVLSWPVVILALGLFFLIRFRTPVAFLIDRIASIKLPGGSELLLPQQATRNLAEAAQPPPVPIVQPEAAPGNDADARLRNERERATLWEYRFLNRFLVPNTQNALDWLANHGPTTYPAYDTWFIDRVQNPVERAAMIDALRNHHLINVDGDLMTVTDKGLDYLQRRGPLAQYLTCLGDLTRAPAPVHPPAPAPAAAAGVGPGNAAPGEGNPPPEIHGA